MHNNKISKEQKQQLFAALDELATAEPSILLKDIDHLFFMALEADFMNGEKFRAAQTVTYLHLHNFLAKLEMIYKNKDTCHLLAM